MNAAYIDIETATDAAVLFERFASTGQPASTLAAWVQEHAADEALNPIKGRVVCWAVCTEDGREHVLSLAECGFSEVVLLEGLVSWLDDADEIVAHNGSGFDFPFLRARALAGRVPFLARLLNDTGKPWESRLVDTAHPSWSPRPATFKGKGWGYSLDALAELLGIQRPPTTPGAEVPAAWYRGEIASVRAHCLDDVRTLRAVTRILRTGRSPR
jgi:hypothetical protein